jgi:rod shape determining protein RodA
MKNIKNQVFSLFDWWFFFPTLILILFGIACIYSSGMDSAGNVISTEYLKQIIFASTGLVLMILAALFDFRKYTRYSPALYIGINVVLLFTCFFGKVVNGARSWLGFGSFGIQPSEFGKIVFILFLAWFLESSRSMVQTRRFLLALGILVVPMGLILMQPDLGTASVYIPIFIVMCFLAGIPVRYLLVIIGAGMLTVIFTMLPVWADVIYRKPLRFIQIFSSTKLRLIVIAASALITSLGFIGYLQFRNRYYLATAYVFAVLTFSLLASVGAGKVLKDYQIKRLIVFLDPNTDPLGSGWTIIQSMIAIGSGGLRGQGFTHGTQSHYRFLPQHSTDFIFSILSEEWGFLGGMIVFILYFVILIRIITIIKSTMNFYAVLVAAGILGMFFFHFLVNIGMVMGMMPITGIPLMFLSYGGSSLWTAMICIGLLMGINSRRLQFLSGE